MTHSLWSVIWAFISVSVQTDVLILLNSLLTTSPASANHLTSNLFLKSVWRGHGQGLLEDLLVHRANVSWRWRETQMIWWHGCVLSVTISSKKKRCLYVLQIFKIKFYEARLNSGWLNLNWVSGLPCKGFLDRLRYGLSMCRGQRAQHCGMASLKYFQQTLIDLVCLCWCIMSHSPLQEGCWFLLP